MSQTSVLCEAAVHAGVVSDSQGGLADVSRERSLTLYESAFANGILSKMCVCWNRPLSAGGVSLANVAPDLCPLPTGGRCLRRSCSSVKVRAVSEGCRRFVNCLRLVKIPPQP